MNIHIFIWRYTSFFRLLFLSCRPPVYRRVSWQPLFEILLNRLPGICCDSSGYILDCSYILPGHDQVGGIPNALGVHRRFILFHRISACSLLCFEGGTNDMLLRMPVDWECVGGSGWLHMYVCMYVWLWAAVGGGALLPLAWPHAEAQCAANWGNVAPLPLLFAHGRCASFHFTSPQPCHAHSTPPPHLPTNNPAAPSRLRQWCLSF